MAIADLFSNRSRCKIATKSVNYHQHETASTTSKSNKLTRFFQKLTLPHHYHRHLLKRPSVVQINPPIFQSDSQLPIIDHQSVPDKDKMYERRHYQETTSRMQRQPFKNHIYALQQNEQLATFCGKENDSTCLIRRRPSLTTSPSFDEVPPHQPSISSSGRNSTINANIHSDNNSISSNDNSGDDDGYPGGGDDTEHGNSGNSNGKNEVLENSRGNGISESNRISPNQQSSVIDTRSHSKYTPSILSIEHLLPVIISDDNMVVEQTTQTTQLIRKASAPHSASKRTQHQHQSPWVLQELRRMNTVSNDSPSTSRHQYHISSSLQRNRSYVIRKGRFEISIEPSD